MKTIAISGYFDPLHVGHLEYIELAAELGDHLTVIVNNDFQCELKKGKSFIYTNLFRINYTKRFSFHFKP